MATSCILMRTLKKIGMMVCAGFFLTSCTSSTVGGRSQFFVIPADELNRHAAASYQQIRNQAAQSKTLLPDSAPMSIRVNRIGQRLIAQVGFLRRDATTWPWSISVIKNEEPNAMCLPGGRIVVFDGIINQLKLTDDELAVVLGHEIAHALREHAREKSTQNVVQSLALTIGGAMAGLNSAAMNSVNQLGEIGLSLPFSRAMETEADMMGLELTARAGYNPQVAPNVWKKMSAAFGERGSSLLSTHPSHSDRIANLTANIPRVMPFYEAAVLNQPVIQPSINSKKK